MTSVEISNDHYMARSSDPYPYLAFEAFGRVDLSIFLYQFTNKRLDSCEEAGKYAWLTSTTKRKSLELQVVNFLPKLGCNA